MTTNREWLYSLQPDELAAWFDMVRETVDANDDLTHKNDVDADAVDDSDANDALQLMRECCVADILDALGIDRREKNHTRKMVQALADMVERDYVRRDTEERVNTPKRSETLRNEQDSREKLEADARALQTRIWQAGANSDGISLSHIIELLDRQAAITERELCKQCDLPSLAAQPDEEAYERIANLTDDLETAYAKNRVLRAHISKMQNGRNGWHIKAEKLQKQIDELTAERDALADDLLTCNKEREEYRELFSQAITQAAEIVNLQP